MTDQERDDFPNLILLCKPHHEDVDAPDGEARYPADELRRWKAEHEALTAAHGKELRGLTEERLHSILQETQEQAMVAVLQNDSLDSAAAELLQAMLTFRVPEEDLVYSLERAASALSNLEGDADTYERAARTLSSLEGNAERYEAAARTLGDLEGLDTSLSGAADRLMEAISYAECSFATLTGDVEHRTAVLADSLVDLGGATDEWFPPGHPGPERWSAVQLLTAGAVAAYLLPSILLLLIWLIFLRHGG